MNGLTSAVDGALFCWDEHAICDLIAQSKMLLERDIAELLPVQLHNAIHEEVCGDTHITITDTINNLQRPRQRPLVSHQFCRDGSFFVAQCNVTYSALNVFVFALYKVNFTYLLYLLIYCGLLRYYLCRRSEKLC